MTEQEGHISSKFKVSNDSSVFIPARVNLPLVSVGKIYMYENDPIPPTDTDKVFGYDPVEFVSLDPAFIDQIKESFIQEQTQRYTEARKLLISTYEKYEEDVQHNLAVEMEGDADFNITTEVMFARGQGVADDIIQEISRGKSAEAAAVIGYNKRMDRYRTAKSGVVAHVPEQLEQQLTVLQHHLHPTRVLSSLRDAPEGSVIFCKNIPPAEVLGFVNKDTGLPRFAGIICTNANLRGHAAIIAKSLGIPFVVVDPAHLPTVKTGYECIIDGGSGSGGIVLHPSAALMKEAVRQKTRLEDINEQLRQKSSSDEPLTTLDGQAVSVYANFGSSFEAQLFKRANVEGIGLYRTEMAENMRTQPISEDHWIKIFRKNLQDCSAGEGQYTEAVIRTLDIAGDKVGRFKERSDEEKAKYEAEVTKVQMGALLRLNHELVQQGHEGKIKVMIPMISSVEQMEAMQKLMDQLAAERHVPTIKLGCMGEVPALFDKLDRLDVAFMSIGSNDLVYGFLDPNRRYEADSMVKYDPTDLSVLHALGKAVVFGQEKDIPISICGDMASEPRYLPLVIGAGITKLSAAINSAPLTKEIIRRIDSREAKALFELLQNTPGRSERERILDHFNATRLGLWQDGRIDMDWNEFGRKPFDPAAAGPSMNEPT